MRFLNNKLIRKNEDDGNGRFLFIYRECLKFKIPKHQLYIKNNNLQLNEQELKNFLNGLHKCVNNFMRSK